MPWSHTDSPIEPYKCRDETGIDIEIGDGVVEPAADVTMASAILFSSAGIVFKGQFSRVVSVSVVCDYRETNTE